MTKPTKTQQELAQLRQRVSELETLAQQHAQMEQTLAEERNLLRTLIDNHPDHIFVKDTHSCFLLTNLASARHLGVSDPDEVVGKTDFDFSPSDFAAQYFADEQTLFESGQPLVNFEQPILDRYTDRYRFVLSTKVPLKDNQGRIIGLVGVNRDITERKEAEEALRQSKQQVQDILESITDAFFAVDAQDCFTYINRRAEQILGKPKELLLGASLWQHFPQLLSSKFYAEYRRAITEQVTVELEEFFFSFQIWLKLHIYPYAGGLSVYFRDNSERKRTEQILAQRAAQLALINHIGSKIAAVLELEQVLDQAARLVQATFSYDHVALFLLEQDEVRLKAIAGIYKEYFPANHSQDIHEGIIGWVATSGQKILANDIQQEPRYISLIAHHTQTQAELCLPIQVAGQIAGVLDIQSPYLNAFGENDVVAMEILTHQIAVAIENARLYEALRQELNDRKRAEAELQQYRLRLEDLVDERTAKLTAANQQLQQAQETLQLYTQRLSVLQEIDRAILTARSPEAIAQGALRHIQRLVPCGQASVLEFDFDQDEIIILADDRTVQSLTSLNNRVKLSNLVLIDEFRRGWPHEVPDISAMNQSDLALQTLQAGANQSYINIPLVAKGQLIGCLNLEATQPEAFTHEHVDIAREVADQLAVAIQQSRLHVQVQRHTAELEQRVADRTAQLEEINEELKNFTFSVSHDLRAPLRAVRGYTQALLEDRGDQLDQFGQEYIQRIISAAERMDLLVQDLLTYSRLSRADLQLKPVNLMTVMTDVLTHLELPDPERQAVLMITEPLPFVLGHYATLVQVIINLLTNAIKFVLTTVRPQVRIWTELTQAAESGDGPWVRLWIEDNGIGIAPEHQERIFHIFERLHGIEAYPGTGVGLAIVRKGMARMGGQVGVESQLGQGSKFWIELPAAE